MIVDAGACICARMREMSASGDKLTLISRAASTADMPWPSAVFTLKKIFFHDPRAKRARS